MIHIEEKEIVKGRDEAYKKAGSNAYFGNGFQAGVDFALNRVKNLTIPVVTTRLFFFDCWKRDGVLETKEIEATCEEHATLKFEKEFGEDYGFDPPYC